MFLGAKVVLAQFIAPVRRDLILGCAAADRPAADRTRPSHGRRRKVDTALSPTVDAPAVLIENDHMKIDPVADIVSHNEVPFSSIICLDILKSHLSKRIGSIRDPFNAVQAGKPSSLPGVGHSKISWGSHSTEQARHEEDCNDEREHLNELLGDTQIELQANRQRFRQRK